MTPGDRWLMLLFGGGIFAAFGFVVAQDFSYAKLSAVFFFLAWFPLLVIHEFAHAIAANMVGWRLEQLVIGFGNVKYHRKMPGLQNMDLYVRAIPLEGFVQCAPNTNQGIRWKGTWVSFAGPGSELAIGILMIYAVASLGHPGFTEPASNLPIALCQGIGISAFFGAILNLFPHGVMMEGGAYIPNDGQAILGYLFGRLDHE